MALPSPAMDFTDIDSNLARNKDDVTYIVMPTLDHKSANVIREAAPQAPPPPMPKPTPPPRPAVPLSPVKVIPPPVVSHPPVKPLASIPPTRPAVPLSPVKVTPQTPPATPKPSLPVRSTPVIKSGYPPIVRSKPASDYDQSNKRLLLYSGAVLLVSAILAVGAYFIFKPAYVPIKNPAVLETKLPKVWLKQHFGIEVCENAPVCGDEADRDFDGLTNYEEFKEDTDPWVADTDKDGLSDGDELHVFKTEPKLKYTDRSALALENDFNDGNKVLNGYDPLTPGIKMTEARKKQIADDTTKYGLHEPTVTTFKSIPPPPVVPAAKTVSVFIENNKFNPADAVINKGDTIVWLNKDKATHVIASDPHPAHTDLPALVSGNIEEGKTFSFKFDTAGKFGYHDHLKPATKGTVEVK